MPSQVVQDAINQQINMELQSSYAYLAMSAYCEKANFLGAARWLRAQSQEEYGHAMRLFDYMLARHANVTLQALTQPRIDYSSLTEVFATAYKQEQEVTQQINRLYEVAFREKSYDTVVQTEWFLNEQVEEEKTARSILGKLEMVNGDPPSLLEIDRELGQRAPGSAEAEEA